MKSNLFGLHADFCLATVIILLASAVTFSGCKKEQPATFVSDKASPAWTATPSGDMTSSMTAVVKVDLKAQYPFLANDFVIGENDLLAAFVGETCVDARAPQEGLFFLYITVPASDTPSPITLRYYSAQYKNLFMAANAFVFRNDDHHGTVSEPFIPAFVEMK